MAGIHLQTLGGLRIRLDGRELRDLPAQPVRCALLLYLAVERGATRDELMTLLWPERDTERARRSLSQTLYELRRGIGDARLVLAGDRVEAAGSIEVDAVEFAEAVATGADERAVALYGGPFLAGSHLAGTRAFESWVDRQRTSLARLHGTACRRRTAALVAAGDLEAALALAQRWAELDPLDDEAQHSAIELLARAGRRSDALRRYDEYAALLAAELEVQPLEQTLELVARIRSGDDVASLSRQPEVGGSSGGPDRRARPPASAPAATVAAPAPADRREGSRPPAIRGRDGGTLGRAARAVLAIALLTVGTAAVVLVVRSAPGSGTAEAVEALDADIVPVAVLPFLNLSADPEQEYFSDGITEDLLTSLSGLAGLRVISRASAWHYKGSGSPVGEIARELGVRYVLQGSVRREGEQVRIAARLVDAATGAQLWAETYDRQLEGIFRVQSEIAQRIADELQRTISPQDHARLAGGRPANPEAYDFLLRGREYLNRPGEADIRKFEPATRFFRRALEIDPSYARAYIGLSDAYRTQPGLTFAMRRDSALVFARRAVELDPGSAEAVATLGWALMISRQHSAAEREMRRALSLDPNLVAALSGLARLAWIRGAFDDAVRWQRRAASLDPSSPQQLGWLGSFLLDIGDLDGAEAAYRRAAELAPDGPASSYMVAQIALIRGDTTEAETWIHALAAAASDHPGTQLLAGRFHAQHGRYAEAEAQLSLAASAIAGAVAGVSLQQAYAAKRAGQAARQSEFLDRAERDLEARLRDGVHAPRLRLQLQALSGDRDGALETLRRQWRYELAGDLLAGPQIGLYWLDRDPLLEDLASDPEFQAEFARIRAELDAMRSRLD